MFSICTLNDNQSVTNILPLSETLLSCDKSIRNSSSCSLELLDALVICKEHRCAQVFSSFNSHIDPLISRVSCCRCLVKFYLYGRLRAVAPFRRRLSCEWKKKKWLMSAKRTPRNPRSALTPLLFFFPRLFSWLARRTSPKRREVLVV